MRFHGNNGYTNASQCYFIFHAYVYVVKLNFFLRLEVHVENPCHANVPEKLPHEPGAVYFVPTVAEVPYLH
jgi:hypothetical protein